MSDDQTPEIRVRGGIAMGGKSWSGPIQLAKIRAAAFREAADVVAQDYENEDCGCGCSYPGDPRIANRLRAMADKEEGK